MSVLGDGRRPVRRVFDLEQRTLFVELSTPGRYVYDALLRAARYSRSRRRVVRFMSLHSPSNHGYSGRFRTMTDFAGTYLSTSERKTSL